MGIDRSMFTPAITNEHALAVWRNCFGCATEHRDVCGALVRLSEYGMNTEHGWEVDHIHPVASGGGNDLSNLRPLHHENNRAKGASLWSNWKCAKRGS